MTSTRRVVGDRRRASRRSRRRGRRARRRSRRRSQVSTRRPPAAITAAAIGVERSPTRGRVLPDVRVGTGRRARARRRRAIVVVRSVGVLIVVGEHVDVRGHLDHVDAFVGDRVEQVGQAPSRCSPLAITAVALRAARGRAATARTCAGRHPAGSTAGTGSPQATLRAMSAQMLVVAIDVDRHAVGGGVGAAGSPIREQAATRRPPPAQAATDAGENHSHHARVRIILMATRRPTTSHRQPSPCRSSRPRRLRALRPDGRAGTDVVRAARRHLGRARRLERQRQDDAAVRCIAGLVRPTDGAIVRRTARWRWSPSIATTIAGCRCRSTRCCGWAATRRGPARPTRRRRPDVASTGPPSSSRSSTSASGRSASCPAGNSSGCWWPRRSRRTRRPAARRAGHRARPAQPAPDPRRDRAVTPADGGIVVFSTHHLAEARRADRVMLMAGCVLADGAPDDVLVPQLLAEAFGGRLIRDDGIVDRRRRPWPRPRCTRALPS